jgi:hypothetical protein
VTSRSMGHVQTAWPVRSAVGKGCLAAARSVARVAPVRIVNSTRELVKVGLVYRCLGHGCMLVCTCNA